MVMKKFPVFMDLGFHAPHYLRMTFELFHDSAPFTAENFRGLCTGEKGFSPKAMRPLWFSGRFFYLRKGCSYVKGGVFCCETGEGGESLMGSHLPAESNNLKHDRAGLLSTRRGDGSNFLVTLEADQSLDRFISFIWPTLLRFPPSHDQLGSHVVFGKVDEGFGTLLLMRDYGVEGAKIVDSGELYNAELPKHVVVTRYLSHAVDKDQGSVSRPVIHNTSSQSASKDTGRRPAGGKMKKGKISVREQRPLLVYFRKKRIVHG